MKQWCVHFPSVSPEVVEETFFLFSSGEWEAACDSSSPLDTPGAIKQSEDDHVVSEEACRGKGDQI